MKEAKKAFSVYKDFIKDVVFLMLIVQALGDISAVLASPDWTFANTVSVIYKKYPIFLKSKLQQFFEGMRGNIFQKFRAYIFFNVIQYL